MKDKLSLLKSIGKEIQIGIIITDIIMTLYVLWLICTNSSSWIMGVLFGFTPYGAFELYRASNLYGLCLTHKLMLLHTIAVYLCCIYQAYFGFGEVLEFTRMLMFLTGLLLIIMLIYGFKKSYFGLFEKRS